MQDKINIGQNRSVLQRFLGGSILSYGLRNSIYMQFLRSTSLYHKEDSFDAPEVFDSSFLDFELVYKTTVVTLTGVTQNPLISIFARVCQVYIYSYSETSTFLNISNHAVIE